MKLGFIGMGNMAQAIAKGVIGNGRICANDVYAYAPNQDKLKANADRIGFVPESDISKMVEKSDVIVIACKPYQIEGVLEEVKDKLKGKTIVSVAAGWVFDTFHAILSDEVKIQCIMPNTPSMVGEGVLLFESKNSLDADTRSEIMDMFGSLGIVEELPTNLMGIGGAISGCGPAFMDMIIEAYADAAVKYGIARPLAYKLVSQTMLGSAKLQLESGAHPGALKDAVCSPNGTTICGVAALEKAGLRSACIESIDAIMNKKK